MNYMKQVAEMLGVELDEEFAIISHDKILRAPENKFYLCNIGLFKRKDEHCSMGDDMWLRLLLAGKAEIKKLPFKPKREEIYWYVAEDGTTLTTQNGYSPCRLVDQYNILHGNCYRTREEAEKHKDEWVQFFKEAVE